MASNLRIVEIIPARRWRHVDGRTASLYGSCPWTSAADKANWTMVDDGYTWRRADGTVGIGRRPASTMEEAKAVMDRVNELHR